MSFNGSDISVEEVKSEILKKNRFGKSNDFELQLINADTGKVFGDDKAMILKNTSVLYARIPRVLKKRTPKTCNKNKVPQNKTDSNKYVNPDFSLLKNDAEKIDAMMHQSTVDYNAVNYPTEVVNKKMPQHYVCLNVIYQDIILEIVL
ncbi:PREDICTED: E3 ubiquitin-protein ligase RBBP6-like [Nicrophorus vespilloides]|uniref:E3 ubiquitin-protein ligase RBBP6-like n=1 Tax=Nicrophorus vespilloides TaxID=110193 RepID=A0ABM1NA30_NICVS|nr:PREDICTED: E3 ubiquitin-protein ligase RBBP6-like [Nicrophorus vespilloides]